MNQSPREAARVYVEADMTEGELLRIALGEAIVYSSRSPLRETPNEDAAALIPFGDASGVLVIADGAGGLRDGARASALAVDALTSAIRAAQRENIELREAILNGIESANQAVTALGTGAATTLAAAELQNGSLRPYHVGDSLILVTGQKGKVKLQTISHSPVGYAIQAGLLDEANAMHHVDRHLVSNFIGTADMHIDVGSTVKLAPHDTVVIATDGLFDNLHVGEIVERARKGKLRQVARSLADACHQRMQHVEGDHPSNPDDLTFIVFRSGK
ncbi:MAG: protein phosphatase 2C domain-containing protein [Gammaproteobacteria bacterium]|nr:protein phosphatase 2C domain-containing protein [Gammaproteobacteria bacterium]MCI0591783.1 protein phosphatase 2C domain-containing protein [Gammaproteobacteria bacterium]